MSNDLVALEQELHLSRNRLEMMLGEHVPVEKFIQLTMIAVSNNPKLLDADRPSLINAIMQCAADGLKPDGREAFFNIKNTKVKVNGRDTYVDKVVHMVMVRGICMKLKRDPNILDVHPDVIYEKDFYEIESGSNPNITHKPTMLKDRGAFVAAYVVVFYRNGGKHQEVMRAEDVAKARACAQTDGVWVKWFDEKAKSSVLHRSEKRLDLTEETREFMRRVLEAELASPEEIARRDANRSTTHSPLAIALAKYRGEALPAPEDLGTGIPAEGTGDNFVNEFLGNDAPAPEQKKAEPLPEVSMSSNNDAAMKKLAEDVRDKIKGFTDSANLYNYWTMDAVDDLAALKKHSESAYDFIRKAYDRKLADLGNMA